MARVIADMIDGDVRLDGGGATVRRIFHVRELGGAASGRLLAAAQASGIPRVGDAHPILGGTVRVSEVNARATGDPAMAMVEVVYAPPSTVIGRDGQGVEVQIVSDLITEETIYDVNGVLMATSYTVKLQLSSFPGSWGSLTTQQVHRVEVQRPTFALVFSRIEPRAPRQLAALYAGTVNQGRFQGEDVDKWLCNVESSQESASAHRVRYSFTLNRRGWQAVITHQSNGIIPTNVSSTNGVRTEQVYERRDFNALGLPGL